MAKKSPVKSEEVSVVYARIDDIDTWPRNPKTHDVPGTIQSITQFGFINPLVRDSRTNRLVAGHGRLEAAFKMFEENADAPPKRVKRDTDGMWMLPVLVGVEFESESQAEAYVLADNRLVELGGWNDEALNVIIRDLTSTGVSVPGWSPEELAGIINAAPSIVTPPELASAKTPEEKLQGYLDSSVRQVVLHYSLQEYEEFVALSERLRSERGAENNAELVLGLLREHAPSASE